MHLTPGQQKNANTQPRAMISPEALRDFKRIWREEKGKDISDELALEEAVNLLTFYDAIYHPIKKQWLEEYFAEHPKERDES